MGAAIGPWRQSVPPPCLKRCRDRAPGALVQAAAEDRENLPDVPDVVRIGPLLEIEA